MSNCEGYSYIRLQADRGEVEVTVPETKAEKGSGVTYPVIVEEAKVSK